MKLILLIAACLAALAQTPAYVDVHIHLRDEAGWIEKTAATYAKHRAVACLSATPEHMNTLKEAARKHPAAIKPVLWIDLDHPQVLEHIDQAHLAGFVGLKIHSPEKNYDDRSYALAFARAEQYGLLTLLHTGISFRPNDKVPRWKGSAARMRPMYLDTLARAFPSLNLVGAHLGNPWYDEAAEVARWNPNVWFDVTGSTLIKKKDDLAEFRRYLWWGLTSGQAHMPKDTPHAFEKLLFGTDNDALDVMIERYTALFNACQVPDEVRKKVFTGTASRLLRLP
ncbi:MAG: hypothetical protein FJW20_01520 [Acidimicrobiia bacterium]|nr:hypothetical protein [Acidimicrobiia bacterium]